jgi:2-polyprenyl-3-methyl-5-hydroxy-6-metoxy-1,4-benzoquinol methylase
MEKFIIWTRFKTVPIDKILEMIPVEGIVLDVGCGFGVFSYFFAQKYPKLEIIGVDLSANRISLAENVYHKPENLHFKQNKIEDLVEDNFDSALFIDVLYLLSEKEIVRTLEICHQKIKEGGTLIIKAMNKDHFLRYLLSMSITAFITAIIAISRFLPKKIRRIVNKVFGSRKELPRHYCSKEFNGILEKSGWKNVEIYDLPMKFFIYPNVIYFCKK